MTQASGELHAVPPAQTPLDASAAKPWRGRTGAVVRWLVAGLLLAAAALKTQQLASEPTADRDLFTYRWSLILLVEGELGLGLMLLSGLWKRLAWTTALATFLFFAAVSLHKALRGEVSCGCFGTVQVNPWQTFALDVVVVTLLALFRPENLPVTRPRLRLAVVLAVLVGAGVPAALAMADYSPARLSPTGEIRGDARFVVLEPEHWVGQNFPLLKQIDVGPRLAQGQWTVVLFHHDCPACRKALPEYEQAGGESSRQSGVTQVALIELPPYEQAATAGSSLVGKKNPCLRGKLSSARDWFVGTPTVVSLLDGKVLSAVESKSEDEAAPLPDRRPFDRATATMAIKDSKDDYDFGFVEPGTLHHATLAITNSSNSPVDIRRLKSECKCITARLSAETIPPGGTASLEVTLNAPQNPISYAERVLVQTAQSSAAPLVVTVKARVGLPCTVEPPVLDLGKLASGEERRGVIAMVNAGSTAVRPIYATSTADDCVAQVPRAVAPANGRIEIPVVVKAGHGPGPQRTAISIQTDSPGQPTLQFSVVYEVTAQPAISQDGP
jgi:hypothetical protein